MMLSIFSHADWPLIPSLQKSLFRSSTLLKITFCLYGVIVLYNVLDISSLSEKRFANIFLHPMSCLFTFLMVSSEAHIFKFDYVHLVYFLDTCAFGICLRRFCLIQDHEDLLLYFLRVLALILIFRYMNHWVNFCVWCEKRVQLHSLYYANMQVSQHHLMKIVSQKPTF